MYPAVLPFHPELAEHMLDYRFYALDNARAKAKSNGWTGAQFPWESAFTGVETCPVPIYAKNEIHIAGKLLGNVHTVLLISKR